jgi:uncharacterized phosphosugar-binding protein
MPERREPAAPATTATRYLDAIDELLARARAANRDSIPAAASIVADTVEGDGVIQTFGSGHSQLLALEAAGRAGGYAGVQVIFDPGMGRSELVEGYARSLLRDRVLDPRDCLIVASNSGRNPAPIEMAMAAAEAGLPIIAITALDYARSSRSRHSSGKHLHDLADVVLDTGGPPGDAVLRIDGAPVAAGAMSTVIGAALLNAVLVESVAELVRRGVEPPLVRSYNMDGSDDHNERMFARYRGRVNPVI